VSKVTQMIGSKISNFVDIFAHSHLTFFFFLPNTTAFSGASLFNADISQWVVSSVTKMANSKSCLANC